MKAPNAKEAPNLKRHYGGIAAPFGIWSLEFLWSLAFGNWCLVQPRPPSSKERQSEPQPKGNNVSEPEWPWQRLRQEKPGQFEKPIEPAPDGDSWFHARIIIENRQVRVYVNGATEPLLVVNELSERPGGSLGLWCNGYGIIANLKIIRKK